MKYAKIIKNCVKRKQLTLFTDAKDQQWITDGCAVYPMLGMPLLDETAIRSIYDIPEGVNIKAETGLPSGYNFSDVDETENQVFPEKIQLPIGDDLASIRTQEGVTFVSRKYIQPIEDDDDYGAIGLYERISDGGMVYIAVKSGWRLQAIIIPVRNAVQKDWLEELKELISRLSAE